MPTERRRILLVADAASPIVQRWLHHCVATGYETYIFTCEPSAPDIPGVHRIRIAPTMRLTGPVKYVASIPRLRRAVREINPEIVHSHYGGGYGLIGALSGARTLIVSLWGSDVLVAPKRSRIRAAVLRWMLRRAAAVCVNSQHLARAASNYTSTPIHLTYFGVEPQFYASHLGERSDGAPLRLAIVKTFTPNSGIDVLLTALTILRSRGVSVDLVAVGPDPGGRAQQFAHDLGVSGMVRFVGPAAPAKVAEVLRGRDLYVQPTSFAEGFGIAVVEAQACGLPAVVTSVGGLVEAVAPISGTVVPPQDAGALADAIATFAHDAELLRQSRAQAHVFALAFRWDEVAPAMNAVYDNLHASPTIEPRQGPS